jgi:allophanate hydrolase subunit 2
VQDAAEAGGEIPIRVRPGPQRDGFEPDGLAAFLRGAYRVSASSDRRGIRLEGPAVANSGSSEIPPEGTVLGAIQVPGDGQPIILGPDRPVTGGYAKIATVLESDFSRVARALPGTVLRFREAE